MAEDIFKELPNYQKIQFTPSLACCSATVLRHERRRHGFKPHYIRAGTLFLYLAM